MTVATEQENRLRRFAAFFKGYMGVMPILTAAVAPLLTMMKAIPVFESQKTTLAAYSGLTGFLLLAWVFYMRGPFTRAVIPRWQVLGGIDYTSSPIMIYLWRLRRYCVNLLPLFLIAGSVFCYIKYFAALDNAIEQGKVFIGTPYRKLVLEKYGEVALIPGASALQAYYLGIFLFAEMAFVVMALREYVVGVLKIPETEVLGRYGRGQARPTSPSSSAH